MKAESVIEWAARTCSRLKSRARADGLPFNLTPEALAGVWKNRCPVFGFPLRVSAKNPDHRPSVDRLAPALGYTIGNIRVVSDLVNRAKNSLTPGELRRVADWMERELMASA